MQVRKIITSVVDALAMDPARKFVYVEQVYFQMWWAEQSEGVKKVVRQLVKGEILVLNAR
jgi:alpha-mannosidase